MMKDILYISSKYIKKRGLRSFLTMIQIMLGIATITLIFNLVFGIWDGINELEENMGGGIYLLNVVTEAPRSDGRDGIIHHHHQILTPTHLKGIKEIYTVEYLTAADSIWQPLIRSEGEFFRINKASFVGPEYPQILGVKMHKGSFFTTEDYDQKNPVCLISNTVAQQLFPSISPIGQELEFYRYSHGGNLPDPQFFTIIGVFDSEGFNEPYSAITNNHLLIPATHKTTGGVISRIMITQEEGPIQSVEEKERLHDQSLIFDTIVLQIREGTYTETLTAISRQIQDAFGEEYRIQLRAYGRFLEELRNWAQIISLVISGFGFLIVIIGSTGILSTMMVGILERTNQIGLEKAMGAPGPFIFLRFTTEALLISLGGGFMGILLALLLADSMTQLGAFLPVTIQGGLYPQAILLALLVALIFGGLFSIYPALQAVKMEPVEAIRHR